MVRTEKDMQRLRQMRANLITSLVINGLVPLVLFLALRPLFADDVTPLAIAGAVPAVRTAALWVTRRRADWIGAYAVLGFAIAIAVSFLSGGNAVLLKIHEQLLTGIVGLVLLISAIVDKPLLLSLLQILSHGELDQSSDSVNHKRITVVTAVIGSVFVANAVAHTILALTLPTATFLVMSRVVTLTLLGGGIALVWWTRQRVGGSAADDAESSQ